MKVNWTMSDDQYKEYIGIVSEKVVDLFIERFNADEPYEQPCDEGVLIDIKRNALDSVLIPEIEKLERTIENHPNDEGIRKTAAETHSAIRKFIQTEPRKNIRKDLNYYWSGRFFERAERKSIAVKMEGIKSICRQPIEMEDLSRSNEIYTANRKRLQEIYKISDKEIKYLDLFLYQCKERLYGGNLDHPIMLTLFGKQGSGKTQLANIIYKVINNVGKAVTNDIDELFGQFGTLDVSNRLVVTFDEYGRAKKDNVDALKNYINGGIMTIQQKYRKPIAIRVLASLILTTNHDPTFLYGTERASRRIAIVHMDKLDFAGTSLKEVEDCVRNMWQNLNNSNDETNILKILDVNNRELTIGKFEEDLEENFLEWLVSLPYEQKQNLRDVTYHKCMTQTRFEKDYEVGNKTTARMYLEMEKYFEYSISGRVKRYRPTEYLRNCITNMNLGYASQN